MSSLHKKPKLPDFDLIIIGTGAGGGVAAHIAAGLGKKVCVIENDTVGGECPNYGCVPTKALLQAAETYEHAKNGAKFGIKAKEVTFNYTTIKKWKDVAVAHTGTAEGEAYYKSEGITLVRGKAYFISPYIISIGKRRYSAPKILIASGTHNVVPPIPGLAEAKFITYREAINLTKPPKSLFVIGGGAIGCEFSQLFSSFGTSVHIAEFAPRLAFREDPEVSELMQKVFEERGIKTHLSAKVVAIKKVKGGKTVTYEQNGVKHDVTVEEILLATGKAPNTDLGLENAGVQYTKRGITANKYMQTSQPHIYVAGDVAGPYAFTHTASYQSRIAANNMFHRQKIAAEYHAVPRCVFIEPEVACVGMTEEELKTAKKKYKTAVVPISVIGRANTSDQRIGFVKVIASQSGTILGASIVSPRAGEMIHELTLAVAKRLTVQDITRTIHAFPTWSEAVRVACARLI